MRRSVLLFIVGVVLPMVSSFITYTLVTLEANAMPLDETGGLIILLAFLKLLLISTTGVFPIDMNSFFSDLMERQRKKRDVIMDGSTSSHRNATLYQVPDVDLMPCTRRFLCELETVAKTSDKYLPKRANAIDDGEDNWNPEEDVAPEQVDPLSELQIEAVRALFRDEDPTGELSERSKKGLAAIEGLTGSVCEEAYRLCPGRNNTPTKMHQRVVIVFVGIVLPMVSSFITYTFVSMGNTALEVDETGALLIILALIKLMLISTQGVFPIDMNTFFKDLWSRQKRELEPHPNAIALYDNKTLYQHPEVELMPCTRRFLCEMENAAKTSDKYLPRGPDVSYDTNPDEEVAPEEVDPLTEMHIEAVRALFREDDSPGDLSPRCQKALSIVDGLTGPVCEKAYRLCPGRYTSSLVYRTIFDEMNLVVHDYD